MRIIVESDLASHLRVTVTRLARRLRQEAGSELSPSQQVTLATIERHGPLTPSELAVRERVQRPTITRVLARLEEAGLVARAGDPADRRSSLVTITDEGRALLAALRGRKTAFLARRLERLGPQDRATLERAAVLLERLMEDGGAEPPARSTASARAGGSSS